MEGTVFNVHFVRSATGVLESDGVLSGKYDWIGTNHGKPVYEKRGLSRSESPKVCMYFWDENFGIQEGYEDYAGDTSAWWFGSTVGGEEVWATQESCSDLPPESGWTVVASCNRDLELVVAQDRTQPRSFPNASFDKEQDRYLTQSKLTRGTSACPVEIDSDSDISYSYSASEASDCVRECKSKAAPPDKRTYAPPPPCHYDTFVGTSTQRLEQPPPRHRLPPRGPPGQLMPDLRKPPGKLLPNGESWQASMASDHATTRKAPPPAKPSKLDQTRTRSLSNSRTRNQANRSPSFNRIAQSVADLLAKHTPPALEKSRRPDQQPKIASSRRKRSRSARKESKKAIGTDIKKGSERASARVSDLVAEKREKEDARHSRHDSQRDREHQKERRSGGEAEIPRKSRRTAEIPRRTERRSERETGSIRQDDRDRDRRSTHQSTRDTSRRDDRDKERRSTRDPVQLSGHRDRSRGKHDRERERSRSRRREPSAERRIDLRRNVILKRGRSRPRSVELRRASAKNVDLKPRSSRSGEDFTPLTRQPPGRQLHLPGAVLGDDGLRRWLAEESKGLLDRLGSGSLDCVDVSHNNLTDDGVNSLINFLLEKRISTRRLKLFNNRLRAPASLCNLLEDPHCGVRSLHGLCELHLSHNCVHKNFLEDILAALGACKKKGPSWSYPLWMRVERNDDLMGESVDSICKADYNGLKICRDPVFQESGCSTKRCEKHADVHVVLQVRKGGR